MWAVHIKSVLGHALLGGFRGLRGGGGGVVSFLCCILGGWALMSFIKKRGEKKWFQNNLCGILESSVESSLFSSLLSPSAAKRTPSKQQESDQVSINAAMTQDLIPSDLPWSFWPWGGGWLLLTDQFFSDICFFLFSFFLSFAKLEGWRKHPFN